MFRNSEKIMIFGSNIRDIEIENVIKKLGKTLYAYVVPDNFNTPDSIAGIPIKKISQLNKDDFDNLIFIPNLPNLQDEIFDFLKFKGFTHVEYHLRYFKSLSVKEKYYYNNLYNWNINVDIPLRAGTVKDMLSNLKIYIVTSKFNAHKNGGGGYIKKIFASMHSIYRSGSRFI